MSPNTTIHATHVASPPAWALAQRHLIARMDEAAPVFQERYTRADGTFVWRQEWPGMDGSDDGYESYHNWPLFYALGGGADLHARSRFLWDAVTRQFTAYGQVWREFDAFYDWMHHGESSIYFYYFGLADPAVAVDRARTLRFARMYMGEDPEATAAQAGAWAAGQEGVAVTLLQASTSLRQSADLWSPLPPGFALMRRMKEALDPSGTLNPGRFVGRL